MSESIFNLKAVRTLHALEADRWLGRPGSAFWCEWDHRGETPRTLESIVLHLEAADWSRYIKPGSVAIDVGGHSGDTAIPMGLFLYDKSTSKLGTVIVVEPNPLVFDVKKINLSLNSHFSHFKPILCAATKSDVKEIELSDHGNANCNGGVVRSSTYSKYLSNKILGCAVNRYKARGLTLDSIIRECKINDPEDVSFIKIDCEGYDKEILRGSVEFLRAVKPTLYIEWFAWFSPADDIDLFSAIEEIGYTPLNPFTLTPAHVKDRIPDLICVPAP